MENRTILPEEKKSITEKYLSDYKELLPELADNLKQTIEETMAMTFKAAVDEAVEAIRRDYPVFKYMPFEQLKDNKDFQQALKEYMTNNPQFHSEEIQVLNSILPENFYITNNKLANEMTRNFVQKGTISLGIINPNKKGEIVTYNSLTYEGKNISITGRYEFTAYDRAIHNAVCSLYEAGNDTVTLSMVYRAVNGMTGTEYISPQSILMR